MDYPVTVALESGAGAAHRAIRPVTSLGEFAPATGSGISSIGRAGHGHCRYESATPVTTGTRRERRANALRKALFAADNPPRGSVSMDAHAIIDRHDIRVDIDHQLQFGAGQHHGLRAIGLVTGEHGTQ